MIALGARCLVFQSGDGEAVPLTPEMISIELSGEASKVFDQDFVDDAATAVFHYFKHELHREAVTMAEFSEALEKALTSFKLSKEARRDGSSLADTDLARLARECGFGCELVFFPRLRSELREQLKGSPRMLQFSGLKSCVKALTGSRRWNLQCDSLKEQILSYLRECLYAEHATPGLSLIVR